MGHEIGYRSVSQIQQYRPDMKGCPHRYFLSRVKKELNPSTGVEEPVWRRPAAWLPQGTADHAAWEAWERSGRTMSLEDAQAVFRSVYAAESNKMCEATPNFDWWFPSGGPRRTVEDDIERRFGIGLEMVERYIDYYNEHPEEVIWIDDDGNPGIELEFDLALDNVKVRGKIDAVIDHPAYKVSVVDGKTGKDPGSIFQLATYGVAIEDANDVKVNFGYYWMATAGGPTVAYSLKEWPKSRIADVFSETDELIRAEEFDAVPDPKTCKMCDVQLSCAYFTD